MKRQLAFGSVLSALALAIVAIPALESGGNTASDETTADAARSLTARTGAPSPTSGTRPEQPTLQPTASGRYVADQKIVRLQSGTSAHAVAAELGLTVEGYDANRGSAVLSGAASSLEALAGHPEVLGVYRNGLMKGAKRGSTTTTTTDTTPRSHQWHLAGANVQSAPEGLSDVIIAVLDSGVAYRTWCDTDACADGETPTHAQAASLAGVTIVAPADFVDDDDIPLDEHQHGTHIATTIVGQGAIEGVAAGAALMPVRVLDASNQGTEYDLVQGIYHAIEHGADLINLSLTFRPGFTPSPLLLEALLAADQAGVLVFAATGNDGLDVTSWPAISPKVVAVAASAPESDYDKLTNPWKFSGIANLAAYSNASSSVDIVAPGGDLTADRTGDGFPDGILAETISPNDPSSTGYWYFEGTSQSAAIATGAAARALALGAEPDEVVFALQRPARPLRGEGPLAGVGGGYLDVDRTENAVESGSPYLDLNNDVRTAVLPYLERGDDDRVRPAVRFTAVDVQNWAGQAVRVYATLSDGVDSQSIRCWTDSETGTCTAYGDWVALGDPTGHAWTVQVDGLQYLQEVMARPTGVLYATDALELMMAAAAAEGRLPEDFALGVYWAEGEDAELGNLAAAFTFTSGGTGLATSPMGVIATPAAVLPGVLTDIVDTSDGTGLATSPMGIATMDLTATLQSLGTGLATSPMGLTTITIADIANLDGTGLATSPMGFTAVTFEPYDLNLDGTGLATSPMGYVPAATIDFEGIGEDGASMTVLAIDGSGLATSPMGFHGADLFSPGGGGVDIASIEFDGGVAMYDTEPLADPVLYGSTTGTVLASGGFVTPDGRDGGGVLGEHNLAELATGAVTNAPVYFGPIE